MKRRTIGILFVLVLVAGLGLVMTPPAKVAAATHSQEFTVSSTFMIPATVTKITVEAWGAGGAGGGSTKPAGGEQVRAGAGGGGGAYASSRLTVVPGQTLYVVVGAGGIGVSGASGNAGSPSFVGPDTNPANAVVRAAAGSGGTGNTAGGVPAGGAGGTITASLGDTRIAGGDGQNGATGPGVTGGAGGNGANGGGSGGVAVPVGIAANGNPGNAPGGGGGGSRSQGNFQGVGGNGAGGRVVITWVTYGVTVSSTAGGWVSTPGEGIFTYGEEAVVNLVAVADQGNRFVRWTGDVSTIANIYASTTTITMNGDYSIVANFVARYDLIISSTAGGSVTTPGEGVFTYDAATVVNLVAIPDGGYRFVEWTGDVSTIGDVHAAETTIIMDSNRSITANFVKQYDLIVSSTAGGSVTMPGEGMFSYDEGTAVMLFAVADEGYVFVEWTGDVSTIGNVYADATIIIMNGDYSIMANFEEGTPGEYHHHLFVASTAGGSVTEPGEGVFTYYSEGAAVDLVASPDAGYQFVEWTGDVSTVADVNAAETTIIMNGDYSVTANFEGTQPIQYKLSISSAEGGSVTEPGEGEFTFGAGTVVALAAAPDAGHRFVRWTGDVEHITDIESVAVTITMEDNCSITANFAAVGWYSIGGSIPSVGCFIATAAYGTTMAEEIQILREFRDEYLLTNPVGQLFVALYYRVSPPIAEFITDHPALKPIVRAGLAPAVAVSTVAVNGTVPADAIIVSLLVLFLVVAVVIWTARRQSSI